MATYSKPLPNAASPTSPNEPNPVKVKVEMGSSVFLIIDRLNIFTSLGTTLKWVKYQPLPILE